MKTLHSLFVITVLLTCAVNNTSAQDSRPAPQLIAFELSVADVFEMTPTIGFANQPAQQYKRYLQLVRTARPEELIDMINAHANPVVRLYAFHALLAQKANVPAAIQQKMNNDKSKVVAQQGCVQYESTVSALAKKSLETHNGVSWMQTASFF